VSEGLDFADRAGRAVVVTGIPFAMKMDPKVFLFVDFLTFFLDQCSYSISSIRNDLLSEIRLIEMVLI